MYILILWLIMGLGFSTNGHLTSTISFASKESCEKALVDVQTKSIGRVDGICVSTR